MTDKWEYWKLMVRGERVAAEVLIGKICKDLGGDELLAHAQCGYYRHKRRGHMEKGLNLYLPIAFWEADGKVVMKYGHYYSEEEYEVGSAFFKVRNRPVSYEAYQYAVQHDQWADSVKEKPEPPAKKVDLSKEKPVF